MKRLLINPQMYRIRKFRLCEDISLSINYLKNSCVTVPLLRLMRRVVNIGMLSKIEWEKKVHEVTLQDKKHLWIFVYNYKNTLLYKILLGIFCVSTKIYWHVSVTLDIRVDCCTNCHQIRSVRRENFLKPDQEKHGNSYETTE